MKKESIMGSVELQKVAEKMNLKNLTPQIGLLGKEVNVPDINRPALQLTGFFEHFESDRVQVVGYVEYTYLQKLSDDRKEEVYQSLLSYPVPCIIFCRDLMPDQRFLEIAVEKDVPIFLTDKTTSSFMAEIIIFCRDLMPDQRFLEIAVEKDVPIFLTDKTTSSFMAEIIRWLNVELAPCISIHGVLVDVYGVGVLIMGESGIGKSEAALELIKRGHRLVTDDVVEIRKVSDDTLVGTAPDITRHFIELRGIGEAALELIKRGHRLVTDDVVEIRKVSDDTLVGTAPDITRHFIELRGIGIVDVKTLFGVQSVKETQTIDLVITLEDWNKDKQYDRLGLEEEYTEFLGNRVVCHSIPIRPGRNLAIIVESASVNHRQKQMGYNAAQELYRRVQENLTKRK